MLSFSLFFLTQYFSTFSGVCCFRESFQVILDVFFAFLVFSTIFKNHEMEIQSFCAHKINFDEPERMRMFLPNNWISVNSPGDDKVLNDLLRYQDATYVWGRPKNDLL